VNSKQTWKACRSLFRIRFAEALQYRAAAISGIFISVFWAVIECVVYTVFYKYSQNGSWNFNGLALPQTISYVWLSQTLFGLQAMSIDADLLARIKNGDIGVELCRPLDLYFHWFAKSSSGKLGSSWLRMLFTMFIGFLMPWGLGLRMPASPWGLGLFVLSVAMAFLLCSSYAMFVTAIRVNITWGEGPTYMLLLFSGVLSGSFLPLRLWPDFMQTFLRLQPFSGFTDIPAQLYVGSLLPQDALPALALQLIWSLAFVAAGRAVMQRRLKSIIIQGG
jgi:ABC-2 type transport system permease protein